MQIGIVCKVIDNYGDAGFSLRLAKALAKQGHSVDLFHDHNPTFEALYPDKDIDCLRLIDASVAEFAADQHCTPDLLIEPFGTSSEHTPHRFDLALKETFPSTPWLLIDYLSSEDWVEQFHLSQSVDPSTGKTTSYFYPGFTHKTGGLIHCDYPDHLRHANKRPNSDELRLFVFAYPDAPLLKLLDSCKQTNGLIKNIRVSLAGGLRNDGAFENVTTLPFCPQSHFDDLLAEHDVLFIRGEDSFVRAQLAGKPFIWQIYPTVDGAHAEKLASFFKRYSVGMSLPCRSALWDCWKYWNNLDSRIEFDVSWNNLLQHWPELNRHAMAWRDRLFAGPELVKEVLTWRGARTPTLMEKPDL